MKRTMICLMMICLILTGCTSIAEKRHIKAVQARAEVLMEEDETLSKEDALREAERQLAEEEDIKRRLAEGEKIEGYDGYHACRKEVLNAAPNTPLIQFGDMVFDQGFCMSPKEVRAVVEDSIYAEQFVISDVFVSYYPALTVCDQAGNSVLTFSWTVLDPEECSWIKEKGNYLTKVSESANATIPWSAESAFYPGGYLYHYDQFLEFEDTEYIKVKRITRGDVLHLANAWNLNDQYYCEMEDAGYCYEVGEEQAQVGFVDAKTKGRSYTDDEGRTSYFQGIHSYAYTFDTDGNCLDIKQESPGKNWKLQIGESE